MDEITLQRIDKYLRKEMSSTEKIYFEQEMLNNEELRKEVEVTFLLKKSLDDRQRKLLQVKRWTNKKRSLSLKILSVVSVAAILVLAFIINIPENQQYAANDVVAKNEKVVRTQQKAQKVIQSMRHSMEKGNDSEAMQALDDWETSPEKITMNQLTCDSQAVVLSQSEKETLKKDIYELQWLKICLLVKQGEKNEALSLLKSFVSMDGRYKENADSLLKSLEQP
ncbi:MAG: hypothetical protein Q4F85_04290 [Prevotella sp.]|nr:hypothetical protein [Prevotella sp.]